MNTEMMWSHFVSINVYALWSISRFISSVSLGFFFCFLPPCPPAPLSLLIYYGFSIIFVVGFPHPFFLGPALNSHPLRWVNTYILGTWVSVHTIFSHRPPPNPSSNHFFFTQSIIYIVFLLFFFFHSLQFSGKYYKNGISWGELFFFFCFL